MNTSTTNFPRGASLGPLMTKEQLTMCVRISAPKLCASLVAVTVISTPGVKQLQISEVFSNTDLISQCPHDQRLSGDVWGEANTVLATRHPDYKQLFIVTYNNKG